MSGPFHAGAHQAFQDEHEATDNRKTVKYGVGLAVDSGNCFRSMNHIGEAQLLAVVQWKRKQRLWGFLNLVEMRVISQAVD
jgi:hypothetical protein